MVASEHLVGNEWVQIMGATPEGNWIFQLPGLESPLCTVHTRFDGVVQVQTVLDTIVADADQHRLIMVWRGHTPVRDGPLDVVSMVVDCSDAAQYFSEQSGASSSGPNGA